MGGSGRRIVSRGELLSIIHDSWLNMCLLAPDSNTHRGVVVGLEGTIEMVLMEMFSSEARMTGIGAGRSNWGRDQRIEEVKGIMGSNDHLVVHTIIIGFED